MSNLNSFIAFSLLRSRTGDGNKSETELADLSIVDTLGSGWRELAHTLKPSSTGAMTVPIGCGTPAAEWDRSGVSAPQAVGRLVGWFEPSFP
jgi:hypothetical protein